MRSAVARVLNDFALTAAIYDANFNKQTLALALALPPGSVFLLFRAYLLLRFVCLGYANRLNTRFKTNLMCN